ncbi:MAG: NAD(P)/FAD-dependent oxidoreductase [Chloroflexi bacterium]|nr:NAD(P)/FAD-dependent oxidoreductase [Chloroflexota bacterium]MBK7177046.1 NAD(P)/FAD-dependent oxidoreductase [Chloroflexota bacterium]MBK7920581.1 NAD(P)/FAD-dependent oxidoreductase [Chloroflexota bacterium]
MTNNKYDAIIIGGGHNGLITAAYLAKAGKKVLVLEKRYLVGGASVTEELYPGFKFTVFSYVVSLLRPDIVRDLQLSRHGLTVLPLESTLTPLTNGDYLYRDGDHYRSLRDIARHSERDAGAYDEYGRNMYFMAKAVKYILSMVPPDPTTLNPKDWLSLLDMARHFLNLGEEQLFLLAKLMTMSAADFLDQWFESDPLKGTMSASGIIGTYLGPRSPGTAYVLLHHYMGEIDGAFRAWGFAKGGTGGIADAIARSAEALGAEIRCNAPVAQVIVKNGRAVGVALENGDEIYADAIASSLDPKLTFLKLVDPNQLPADLVDSIRKFNVRGSSGKVNLALDALPDLTCMPGPGRHLAGAISISPSIDYIERAFDDAKYGEFSKRPYIDCILPSVIDPGMAPPGKHVMSCFVQYAPYELNGGWTDAKREAFGDAVVDTLSQYMPNLKNIILHRQVLTPLDIENMIGISQGNIFHGELSLSQLFFLRPAAGWAKYRTPIKGYWQCGSGTHPGGGIMGAPGQLAAFEMLKEK